MNFLKKIEFIAKAQLPYVFIMLCVFVCVCGEKTQNGKVYKVGIMSGGEAFANIADGFKVKMQELGYKEGENIIYSQAQTEMEAADFHQVAEEFTKEKVDLIFSFPSEPSFAAKDATQNTNIPVVFALAGIEGNNLIDSVPRPGRNITGVRFPAPESTVRRLEMLCELVPHAKRILLTYDPDYPTAASALAIDTHRGACHQP